MLGTGFLNAGGEPLSQRVAAGGLPGYIVRRNFQFFGASTYSRPPTSTTLRSTVMTRAA
jgi:hypothetical protein